MSLDLKVMEELEAKAPEITTGFVIPIHLMDSETLRWISHVVEDFSTGLGGTAAAVETGHEVFV